MTRTITYQGMEVELYGTFNPGRPAPRCSNPNDARFSDTGEPDEVEVSMAWFVAGKMRVQLSQEMIEAIEDSGVIEEQLFSRA